MPESDVRGEGPVVDLATVIAQAAASHPWVWRCALAALATAPLWADPFTAGLCVAAAATVLFSIPWIPRALVRRGTGLALAIVCGVAYALARRGAPWELSYHVVAGALLAALVAFACEVARAARTRPGESEAEAASARLAVWAQDHALALGSLWYLLGDPIGVISHAASQTVQEGMTLERARAFALASMSEWGHVSAGCVALIGLAAASRSVGRGLAVVLVSIALPSALWHAVHAAEMPPYDSVWMEEAATRGVVEATAVAILAGCIAVLYRDAPRGLWAGRFVASLSAVVALLSVAAFLPLAASIDPEGWWPGPKTFVLTFGRTLARLVLLLAVATTAMRGGAILGGAVALGLFYGAAGCLTLGVPDLAWKAAPLAALQLGTEAVLALAVRRVRSLSSVRG